MQPGQPGPFSPLRPAQPGLTPQRPPTPQPSGPPAPYQPYQPQMAPPLQAPPPMGPPPMGPPPVGPRMPGRGPTMKRPVRRQGMAEFSFRLRIILRNISDRPWRAFSIVAAVAVGVSIAITIIAASHGINVKINSVLNISDPQVKCEAFGQGCPDGLQHKPVIDLHEIQQVLDQTTSLLTVLSIIFTGAIVGLVTWLNMNQRRREIALRRMYGEHVPTLASELVGEAFLLCVVGGVAGTILGLICCSIVQAALPLLPMQPDGGSVFAIFPSTVVLSFAVTAVIATYFANRSSADSKLG